MGKEVATTGGQFALMEANVSELAEVLREAVGPAGIDINRDLDKIKVPAGGGKFWEIPGLEGATPQKTFEGVVIATQEVRAYWAKTPEESGGQKNPPDCASKDGIMGLGHPGGDCLVCPLAQFGTEKKHGRGQACKAMSVWFVMLPKSVMPLALVLPPTSVQAARKYKLRLATGGMRLTQAVTQFSLEMEKNPDGQEYAKAAFSFASKLPDDVAAAMKSFADGLRPILQQHAAHTIEQGD